LFEIGERPNLFYASESEAIEHKNKIKDLKGQVSRKETDENPYIDQISEMETNAIQEANFDKINGLSRVGDHQKFLLDLLTSKDSFVRKKIIDQNLSYLNSRLTSYLDKMGLPHQVVFQNDLSVEITELGRELDFDNLSRGERNRLILGLSFAFRDVWENLYFPINTLFIDELIDSGLDTIGVENAMAILKDMTRNRSKSVWLVSHREELAGRVASVLQVVKENGFTTYNSTRDMENL
jgi:DNA repair exonuclease SbcCD ATPase subunit